MTIVVSDTHIGPYEIHPLCQAIPNIAEEDWPKFRNSVSKNGLHKEIWRFEKKIIGGRQRLRACLETGISPRFRDYEPRGKTSADIESEIREFIKIEDLDRRQLDKQAVAMALARLYPPLPKGRPSKDSGITAQENAQNCAIKRPKDDDLADAAGISRRQLQLARAAIKGCIPAIVKLVDERQISPGDAANVADLEPAEQKQILKLAKEQECSLTAAMRHLHARNKKLPGASVKTHIGYVRIEMALVGETDALRADSAEEAARDYLEKMHLDPAELPCRVIGVGLTIGGIKAVSRCARPQCRCLIYEDTPQKKTERGVQCKECPDGRA